MIVNFFLSAVVSAFKAIFGVLPSLPNFPTVLTDMLYAGMNIVAPSARIFSFILGDVDGWIYLWIGVTIAVLLFEQIYHLSMWLWRKLPISSH